MKHVEKKGKVLAQRNAYLTYRVLVESTQATNDYYGWFKGTFKREQSHKRRLTVARQAGIALKANRAKALERAGKIRAQGAASANPSCRNALVNI